MNQREAAAAAQQQQQIQIHALHHHFLYSFVGSFTFAELLLRF